jgi:hypothetical protein
MLVAEAPEALHRKGVVGTFRFLQAQHIRPRGLDVFGHEVDAKADGIDVPGGDFDLHAGLLAVRRPLSWSAPAAARYPQPRAPRAALI